MRRVVQPRAAFVTLIVLPISSIVVLPVNV